MGIGMGMVDLTWCLMRSILCWICASSKVSNQDLFMIMFGIFLVWIYSTVSISVCFVLAGNVEILHDLKWGNICDDEWDQNEGLVVCQQLGFIGFDKITHSGYFGAARRKQMSITIKR